MPNRRDFIHQSAATVAGGILLAQSNQVNAAPKPEAFDIVVFRRNPGGNYRRDTSGPHEENGRPCKPGNAFGRNGDERFRLDGF